MRLSLMIATIAAAAFAMPLPAFAAYCGPPADATAVQNATVAHFNAHPSHGSHTKIDRTYVMAVVVQGAFAQADIEYAGQASYFWTKRNGKWTFAGNFAPATWPALVTAKFRDLSNRRSNGSKQCTNPHFVSRGSG